MAVSLLVVNFSVPQQPESLDFVLLEQAPMEIDVNYLTKAGVIRFLASKLPNSTTTITTNCGPSDGSYSSTVYAYPYPQELNYRIGISWGSMGDRTMDIVTFTEIIQCDLQTTLKPKYPVLEIIDYDWVGDVYNAVGQAIEKPAITSIATGLTLSEPVYGSLVVAYRVVQHKYDIFVSSRGVENKLQSFSWAVWDGGNAMLELEPPDGAEDGICQGGSSGTSSIEKIPGAPDYVESHDETHHIDYCTMECTDCDE